MAVQKNVSNLRKLKRRHLIYYLEVIDKTRDKLLGHLVDMNVKGIKLVSKEKIEVDKNYSLKMTMPEELTADRNVSFEAKSLWCRQDVNPDFYATGFSAPSLDEEARRLFMVLINQVGFND